MAWSDRCIVWPVTRRTDPAALTRGALVGACSGAIAIAAHGLGGADYPTANSVVVLFLVCGLFGAATSFTSTNRLLLVGQLGAAQILGHYALAVSSDHAHGAQLTALMVASHAIAAGLCAVRIALVERLHSVVVSTMQQVVLALVAAEPAVEVAPASVPEYRPNVVTKLLVSSGLGTRGPPLLAV